MENKNGSVFIIAEAGVNHNGNLALAKKLIDSAKEAGADAVKFQTFQTEQVITKSAQKAVYQQITTGEQESQYEMVKKLELTFDEFTSLKEYCDHSEILFLSTPFDMESIEYLETIDLPIYKIPSGEITNLPYLIRISETLKPIIMSTGMSDLEEIGKAVSILKQHGNKELTLLHCNTEYPTPFEDVNLNAMLTLRNTFQTDVGYSDHTLGIEASVAAVALGATVIEKHFTLDKNMEGPDHKASLNPEELKLMVQSIRNIERALGEGEKKPSKSELKNRDIARKSIVAKVPIQEGEVFSAANITVKRPGNGVTPMRWFDVIGQTAKRAFKEDEPIEL
ncbi:MAG: N-acetylneuraminate synthase [Bacillota bacterium]|jgi:N,N'-diacetyllegionaminate synthase|nr:N-acetylneuraminate synthase [Bacillota bacterium]